MTDKKSGGFAETVKTIVYAGLIALFVRSIAFEPFNIPSSSMVPNLLIGDYLFVSKYSYGYSRYSFPFGLPLFEGRVFYRQPQRGDVAVFKLPSNPSIDYIKRVIGLPGDRIQVREGQVYINGDVLKRRRIEDYVDHSSLPSTISPGRFVRYIETLPEGRDHMIIEAAGDDGPADNTPEYVVPEGHFFMMGDNRDNSKDSRYLGDVGYVPVENLVGRADMVFFSTNGAAALWEVWKWPQAIRFDRFLHMID